MAEDLQRILECPMCFEIYDSSIRWPKLLPCQHTFCQPCLQLLDKNQRINCPQCRIDHISPQGGAKRLPNNFTMLSLIDLHGKSSSVPSPSASNGDVQEQTKINENVKNAIAGLAQKLQQKASDLSKIDAKRKQIEDKFLGIKAHLDAAFDLRAKELQTRREMLIKQLGSLRQEELNFLEGQKASATQYLQKFQQDFAGMRESILAQHRLPNEMELNNLLSMCRGYMQQIDKYALNLDQKDRTITFIDPTKQQFCVTINGYGCINVNSNPSPSVSPVVGGSGDALSSLQGVASTNSTVQHLSSNQQYPGVANQSQTLRPNMSDPSLANRSASNTSSVPAATNSNIHRSASGPNFAPQSSGSSQYMFPPSRVLPASQNVQQRAGGAATPSTILQPTSTAPSSSLAGWSGSSAAQDLQIISTNPSPHSSRSGSPSPSIASMNSENSGDLSQRRRSLNPFLQESPTSLSQSQAISSLSTTSTTTTQSGNIPQMNSSVTTARGHSPLPSRQTSVGALPNPMQSSSRPALSKTRHASLEVSARPPQQSVDLPQMSLISEFNAPHSSGRNMSVDSASAFLDSVLDSPPPLPPRKGAKSNQRGASGTSSSTSSASGNSKWVQFDTLRRDSSPTKAKSVNIIGAGWFGGGFFEKPVGAVSLPNNLVAVVDERNHCVLVVSEKTGQLVRTLGAKGNGVGQFQFPRGICTNTAGHVIVSDWLNNRIQLWEPSGKFVRQFGVRGTAESNLNGPVGVVCDQSDNIYVCDYNNHCVKVFNAAGGFLRQIGKPGQGDGMFQSPSHIVISPGGELLITDAGKHCVQVFTKQGTFLYAVGQWGTGSGQLNCPTGITIDLQGYLYVANSGNHRIEVFNPSGSFSMSLGTQGKEEGQFDEPLGVATSEDGRLIVCDSGNKRLQILLS